MSDHSSIIQAAGVADKSDLFTVTVLPSERVFNVRSNQSLLSASIEQNIGLPYACKDGACGTCKCQLLKGTVTMTERQETALSKEEEAKGLILACRAHATSDVVLECKQVSHANALPVKKMPVRVQHFVLKTDDVMLITMQLPAGSGFQFYPGQYVEFLLAGGVTRSYSIANGPSSDGDIKQLEFHVRHMPGGVFTDKLFGSIKEKEVMRIQGPFGSAYLQEDSDQPIIFLVSGTGFAPAKAMLEQLKNTASTRAIHLYWGARTPRDLYLNDWILEFKNAVPWLNYIPVISEPLPQSEWPGRRGLVHEAVLSDIKDLAAYQVYACGAPIMVQSARAAFIDGGGNLPSEAFFADAFTSEADKHNTQNSSS